MLFMKRNKQEPIDEDVDITATSSDEDIKTSTKSISSLFSGLFAGMIAIMMIAISSGYCLMLRMCLFQ